MSGNGALYVFLMDTGTSFTFDETLVNDSVLRLQSDIMRITKIPIENQVLLASGGVYMMPSENVISYDGAGMDRGNPIFLFDKESIMSDKKHTVSSFAVKAQDLTDRVNALISATSSQKTFEARVQIAAEFGNQGEAEVYATCDLVREQHLMHQGWQAAVANLDELLSQSKREHLDFFTRSKEFFDDREKFEKMLDSFEVSKELLARVPILPCLLGAQQQSSTLSEEISNQTSMMSHPFAEAHSHGTLLNPLHEPGNNPNDDAVVIADDFGHKDVFLLDWIASHDSKESLNKLCEAAKFGLQQMSIEQLNTLQTDYQNIISKSHEISYREIRGLEDRLMKLDEFIEDSRRLCENQKTISEYFKSNLDRFMAVRDPSIMPDLSTNHKQQLETLRDNHKKLRDIRTTLSRSKEEFLLNLNKRLMWLSNLQIEYGNNKSQVGLLKNQLHRSWRACEALFQAQNAPVLYAKSLAELVRRREFGEQYDKWCQCISQDSQKLHEKEKKHRKAFAKDLKSHFLRSLFRSLSYKSFSFAIKPPERIDPHLPNINREDLQLLAEQVPELKDDLQVQDNIVAARIFKKFQRLLSSALTMPLTLDTGPASLPSHYINMRKKTMSQSLRRPHSCGSLENLPTFGQIKTTSHPAIHESLSSKDFKYLRRLSQDDNRLLSAETLASSPFICSSDFSSQQVSPSQPIDIPSGSRKRGFTEGSSCSALSAPINVASPLSDDFFTCTADMMGDIDVEGARGPLASDFPPVEEQPDDEDDVQPHNLSFTSDRSSSRGFDVGSFRAVHRKPPSETMQDLHLKCNRNIDHYKDVIEKLKCVFKNDIYNLKKACATAHQDLIEEKNRLIELFTETQEQMTSTMVNIEETIKAAAAAQAESFDKEKKVLEEQLRNAQKERDHYYERMTSLTEQHDYVLIDYQGKLDSVQQDFETRLEERQKSLLLEYELDKENLRNDFQTRIDYLESELDLVNKKVDIERERSQKAEKQLGDSEKQWASKLDKLKADNSVVLQNLKTSWCQERERSEQDLKNQLSLAHNTEVEELKKEIKNLQRSLQTAVSLDEHNRVIASVKTGEKSRNYKDQGVMCEADDSAHKTNSKDQQIRDLEARIADLNQQLLKDREYMRKLHQEKTSHAQMTVSAFTEQPSWTLSHDKKAEETRQRLTLAMSKIEELETKLLSQSVNVTGGAESFTQSVCGELSQPLLGRRCIKLSHSGFRTGDTVLIFYSSVHEQWSVLSSDSEFYFVNFDCLGALSLPSTPTTAQQSPCLAEYVSRETCQPRKFPNRFHLPLGTKFFRIKVRRHSSLPFQQLRMMSSSSSSAPLTSSSEHQDI